MNHFSPWVEMLRDFFKWSWCRRSCRSLSGFQQGVKGLLGWELYERIHTHPCYSMMASCSHSPTADVPSPFPAPPCYNKLNNYVFAEAPLLPSRPLSSHSLPTLFSSQLYNPHIFWTALDPIRYIDIINPISRVRKLRIRYVLRNLHKVTCQL